MSKKSRKVIVFTGLLIGSFLDTGLHAIDCKEQHYVCNKKGCDNVDWINKDPNREKLKGACKVGCLASYTYCENTPSHSAQDTEK